MTVHNPAVQKETVPGIAWALLLLLAMAWGTTWPMMKIAVAEIPILSFRAFSVLGGATALLIVARVFFGRILPHRDEWRMIAVVGGFNVALWYSLSALALTHLPAGRSALLAFTTPLWAMMIEGLLYKAPLTVRRGAGIVLALAAIALLSYQDLVTASASTVGIAAILAASFSQTFGSILQQRSGLRSPVYIHIGWQILIGGSPIVIGALLLDGVEWMETVSNKAILASMSVTFFSICVGVATWYSLLRITSMGFAAVGSLVVPFAAISLSALILGEPLTVIDAVGLVLITAAVGTTIKRKKPSPIEPT